MFVVPGRPHARTVFSLALLLGTAAPIAIAQEATPDTTPHTEQKVAPPALLTDRTFQSPPAAIERLVTAPWHQNVRLSAPSPDGRYILREIDRGMPTVAELARPHLNLAGLKVDPAANRAVDLILRALNGLEVVDVATGEFRALPTPRGATISNPRWSPDGTRIAYLAHFPDATRAYVTEVRSGKTRAATKTPLLATEITTLQWTADSKHLVAVLIPERRPPVPARPELTIGPQIRTATRGEKQKHRTYPNLLVDEYDEAALEYYLTGQLALLDARGGKVKKIGEPAMLYAVDPAPHGDHFRIRLIQRPFSRLVPYANFGRAELLWDTRGRTLVELSSRPLLEESGDMMSLMSRQSTARADTAKGPPRRSLAWHPAGEGMTFLQRATIEPDTTRAPGDQNAPAEAKGATDATAATGAGRPNSVANKSATSRSVDRLYQWLPPFGPDDVRVLYESDDALGTVRFSADARTIFVTQSGNGASHTYAVNLDRPERQYTLLRRERPVTKADSAAADTSYASLVTRDAPGGNRIVRRSQDGRFIYLDGYRPRADAAPDTIRRPFIDRVELETGARERIYHAPTRVGVEIVSAILDDDLTRIMVQTDSRTSITNYHLRDLSTGTITALTRNTDHAPEITHAQRHRIRVTRVDGFEFWVSVTLPRDYTPGTRLPAFFWFYPREYTDQESYDRFTFSIPNRFQTPGPRSLEFLVTQGYAVIQPDAPIVGPKGRINDNYLHDLRNNLTAIIDELDRQALIDRDRLGIGGHSYGAFSTANALIHTPYFKAGIAGDGNYNRTLTPNGFQTEERDLWGSREMYLEISPILYADRMTGALLLYHGLADQNAGTDPINSIRLLQALQGLGKEAALYLYDYEDHEPVAQETILDLWARWTAWLDHYVKRAGTTEPQLIAQ